MPLRGRRLVVCAGALTACLAFLGAWLATGRGSPQAIAAHPSATAPTSPTPAVSRPPVTVSRAEASSTVAPAIPVTCAAQAAPPKFTVPAETLVATIRPAGAPGSRTPGQPATFQVPGAWWQASSILPVIDMQPGWVQVRLAQRPNGSVAWVPSDDVRLATDPYYIVIDLCTTHLLLFNHGQQVASFPAGIGVPADPTPTGQFFVALFAEAPSPGYGPFVIVTSAHSNTISDWQQSGDAVTAIHGPLGSDATIGTTGARVSHGCVRLHVADQVQLRDIPAGTPIDIIG